MCLSIMLSHDKIRARLVDLDFGPAGLLGWLTGAGSLAKLIHEQGSVCVSSRIIPIVDVLMKNMSG